MFGIALKHYADEWSAANPELNKDGYADIVGLSRAALYKAYKGDITDTNVTTVATKLGKTVEEMISFTPLKLGKHFFRNRKNKII